jgi:hypothetical protein
MPVSVTLEIPLRQKNAPPCPLLNIPSSSTFLHPSNEGRKEPKTSFKTKYPNEKSVSIYQRRVPSPLYKGGR